MNHGRCHITCGRDCHLIRVETFIADLVDGGYHIVIGGAHIYVRVRERLVCHKSIDVLVPATFHRATIQLVIGEILGLRLRPGQNMTEFPLGP